MDLSPRSKRAWAWAKMFCDRETAFEALFVFDLSPSFSFGIPFASIPQSGQSRAAAWLRRNCPGAAVKVLAGDPARAVERRARRADLVVMATHGRQGLGRALMGSTSEAVVRDCRVPVLTVHVPPRAVASVLAPVNLEPYARKGLALAAEAARFLGAGLTVLYVNAGGVRGANPRFFLNQLIAELSEETRKAVKPRIVLRAGDPVSEILRESRRHGLVVLTAHRKSLLSDLVLGTTAERVLRLSRTAVLTAPSQS
jgi:nucleotide-binding universal stress UspA family protein